MHRRRSIVASAAVLLAATEGLMSAGAASSAPAESSASATSSGPVPSGSFAFSGAQAGSFVMPPGMAKVRTLTRSDGSSQTRYQQFAGSAAVFGAQITVNADPGGTQTSVVGAYFPGLSAKAPVSLSAAEAKQKAVARIGATGRWTTTLKLDPRTARSYYEVAAIRADTRPVRWVDAQSGAIVKAFDAVNNGEGVGIKGDAKTIDTTNDGSTFQLVTGDDRQETYDVSGRQPVVMSDPDDTWDYNLRGWRSPSQAPGVDAHYYAGLVDDFYGRVFERNSIDGSGMKIVSNVHYGRNYCNAFWNGASMTYGDGDGRTCLPLSGGLDVVGHELTHGVTEHTSNLIYENEPGALNEAFSDMMGNTIEYFAGANGLDPAATPDWRIGEDVIPGSEGFRNMGDPMEFDDPDHYSLRYTGTSDNGGVHTNSGIANHAYYLMVNGGTNAGCTANAFHGVTHTADCDVEVPAAGLATARQVFYDGFTSLPEYANFCDARNSTVAAAGTAAQLAVNAAWASVGVQAGCTPGTPPPPPCVGSDNASLPFESPHPYGNNGDCTWTYNNGSGGFRFHFSLLDTEKNYDYVYVKDADGTILASYTGTYRRAVTSPCIPTSTGSVQLKTDPAVVGQGFTVDAVEAC